MKAIIPVAGIGTRLRPHTHTAPKVLLPVAGQPILGHILQELERVGVTEITFIIGYRGDQVREYVNGSFRFKANYVVQPEMLGLGHAISLAKPYHDADEPVLIILGDTIFKADLPGLLASRDSLLAVKEVEDPRRFGVVEVAGDGTIRRLVEKPSHPPSNLVIVGIYFLRDARLLFRCLDRLIAGNIRTKNEYQLTDALQMMLEAGHVMRPFPIEGWHDCGKRETLLETNRALLDLGVATNQPARLHHSVIIPPVAIGENVTIERSIIGPHVSVSSGSVVRNSVIVDSIIAASASVENAVLRSSVIFDNARVLGRQAVLNVGDASEIDMS
ncbi:MAG: NTP transferase domain-containing protein [Planctomycetaceae bacterium]|nr:NTP transferase domain-containing protein [Planctomycetaceae bacterium]